MTRRRRLSFLTVVIGLQLSLLTIGIGRDYRLKHEDNNALHATFARSHVQLGLGTTRGQNYFHSPATASGEAYANHPPGPGLTLAVVYSLTGRDGPVITRATAVAFHVLSTILSSASPVGSSDGTEKRCWRRRYSFCFPSRPSSAA